MELTIRQNEILRILSRESDYVPVFRIAEELNVSKRTIHNDLNAMSDNESFRLERKQGVGIRVVWIEDGPTKNRESSVHQRQLEIFHTLLFDEAVVTVQKLSETYYVSPTSIVQDLNTLRKYILNDTTVRLVSDNNGTRFEGSEEAIQRTMLLFNDLVIKEEEDVNYDINRGKELIPYYGKDIVESCLDVVKSLENYNLYNVAKHYELNVLSMLVVMCYRLKLNHHLPYVHNALRVDEVMAMKHYLIAKDLLEMLSQKLSFSYEEPDVYTLAIYLQANRLEFSPSRLYTDTQSEAIAKRMIERMSVCVAVDLNSDEDLRKNIEVHLYHMIYRMKHQVYIRNPLLDLIKKDFRLMFDLTWLVVEGEKEAMDIEVTEDEIGFLMLHFQNALDRAMKSKKVLVVCHNGVVSSGFIVNRIRRILPPLDIIESTSQDAVSRFDLDSVDLIISTIPLVNVKQPVVVVSPLITDRDLEAINKVYQSHLVNQDIQAEVHFESLAPYIDLDFIYVDQEAKTYEEILNRVSDDLFAKGYVESDYKASLFEREANGGTEIATGSAVPHASMDTVKKTIIPVWINKSPVKWGKYSVRVVLFFTLAKSDLGLAKELLTDVFKCVKSKEFLETKLVKLDKTELYKLLSGGDTVD